MKTMRIVHEGPVGSRVRAAGLLFQDRGGNWHAYVPALGLLGYGKSRQAAYRCLEAVCGVHMRLVWPGGQLEGEVRDAGWEEAEGVWHAAVMPYGQLREVLGYMKKGAVMRPFGLMLEMGSERQPGT